MLVWVIFAVRDSLSPVIIKHGIAWFNACLSMQPPTPYSSDISVIYGARKKLQDEFDGNQFYCLFA